MFKFEGEDSNRSCSRARFSSIAQLALTLQSTSIARRPAIAGHVLYSPTMHARHGTKFIGTLRREQSAGSQGTSEYGSLSALAPLTKESRDAVRSHEATLSFHAA